MGNDNNSQKIFRAFEVLRAYPVKIGPYSCYA